MLQKLQQNVTNKGLKMSAGLIFLLAIGVRLLFWTLPLFAVTQYEEAVVGLQALHILKGDHLVFWWAQPYQGSFELYLIAGLFSLFGPSTLVLRIVPFLISLLGLIAVYFLGRTLFNRKVALLALLFLAVPPVFLLIHSLTAYTAYLSLIPLGSILMLWTYTVLFRRQFVRHLGWHYFGIGFLCGFLLWQHLLSICFLISTLVLLLVCQRRFWRSRTFFLFCLGIFLGALPLILWNVTHEALTYTAMVSGKGTLLWLDRLQILLERALPVAFGLGERGWQKILFWVVVTPFVFLLFRFLHRKWQGVTLLLVYSVTPILLYLFFSYKEPRYLFPLYASGPLLLAYVVNQLEEKSRWIARLAMLVLMSLNAFGVGQYWFQIKNHPYREIDQVISFLKEQGINHVFAHSRVALPLCFESNEQIRASDFVSYTDNRFHIRNFKVHMKPFFDEGRAVALADKVGLVTHEWYQLPAASQMEHWLHSLRAQYKKKSFGVYTVFYDITPTHIGLKRVSPEEYELQSSVFFDRLPMVRDGNLSTYWHTPNQKNRCDQLQIHFKRPISLSKISLFAGGKHLEYPENVVAEVSLDGKNWKKGVDLSHGTLSIDWFGKIVRMIGEGRTALYFSGEKVSDVRLSIAHPYLGRWSLAELLVYEAGEPSDFNLPPEDEQKETIHWLREAGVMAVYGSKPLILRLQQKLPSNIRSLNYFERRNERLDQSSARVDFSQINAFIVLKEEQKLLLSDLKRLGVPARRLHRLGQNEVWVTQPKVDLPLMLWKEQQLFDYYSRPEALWLFKKGEEEWQARHEKTAQAYFLASMKKDPNFAAYHRLKECLRWLDDQEGVKKIEKQWGALFEPATPHSEIFGNQLKLYGVTLPESRAISPGQTLWIRCLWECQKPIPKPLSIFVHFLNSRGEVAFQADHPLGDEIDLSGYLEKGEKFLDQFEVSIPENLSPGRYDIFLGWWDDRENKRLPIHDSNGKKLGSRLKIGELQCE